MGEVRDGGFVAWAQQLRNERSECGRLVRSLDGNDRKVRRVGIGRRGSDIGACGGKVVTITMPSILPGRRPGSMIP